MAYTLDENGQLLDDNGDAVKMGNEAVVLEGYVPQATMNAEITKRLDRERKKLDTQETDLKAEIDRLKGKEEDASRLQGVLDQVQSDKDALEEQVASQKQNAEAKVASQMATEKQRSADLESALHSERLARTHDQVENLILGSCGDNFVNPRKDVVGELLRVHKREPKLDDAGKVIKGQFVDTFECAVEKEGVTKKEFLPVDKALEAFKAAPENSHYVRGSDAAGSGGGRYTPVEPGSSSAKRSEMSTPEKTAFIAKHGQDAYRQLPA